MPDRAAPKRRAPGKAAFRRRRGPDAAPVGVSRQHAAPATPLLTPWQRFALVPATAIAVTGLSVTGSFGMPRIQDMVAPAPVTVAAPTPTPTVTETPVALSEPVEVGVQTVVAASKAKKKTTVPGPDVADIPGQAYEAYRAAASAMARMDPKCRLDWSLLAAFGRVESNHGRSHGSALTVSGVVKPGIFGPVLDGSGATARIADTDNGVLDGNKRFDRAAGPMQFIPGTWRIVGADGDRDGKRNPQDIDDAALSAAVYLCAGDGDLGTAAGARAAAMRYNRSSSYADQVVAIAGSYARGGSSTTATATVAAVRVPGPLTPPAPTVSTKPKPHKPKKPKTTPTPTDVPSPTGDPSPTDAPTPVDPSPSDSPPSVAGAPAAATPSLAAADAAAQRVALVAAEPEVPVAALMTRFPGVPVSALLAGYESGVLALE